MPKHVMATGASPPAAIPGVIRQRLARHCAGVHAGLWRGPGRTHSCRRLLMVAMLLLVCWLMLGVLVVVGQQASFALGADARAASGT